MLLPFPTNRPSWRGLCLSCVVWVLAACGPSPTPPNVLLITVDTLRADALGFMGNEQANTPNLDRLAQRGTVFEHALAPIPRTTPAVGSLMTGRWPQFHGSREVGDAIGAVPTLAEMLEERGFTNLAVSANDAAGPVQGLHRGFTQFVTRSQIKEIYGDRLYDRLDREPEDPVGWATAVTDQALDLLAAAPRNQPYFLWLLYFDPHFPYDPPPPWQDGVEAPACLRLYEHFMRRRMRGGLLFANVGRMATPAVDDCRRLYQAEVSYTDHEIGRLLAAMEADGRLEQTVIVLTADHGENFGEAGLYFEHGNNAHDAGLRVPLVFAGPGIAQQRRVRETAGLIDLFPTLLSLLGFADEGQPKVDGVSLASQLSADQPLAESRRPRVMYAESATTLWNEFFRRLVTGRAGRRQCINGERFSLCEEPVKAPGVYRLYDFRRDPLFTRDLAAEHPELVSQMLEYWQAWPPESARDRAARSGQFKLIQTPRLEGGFHTQLVDLLADPSERSDVSDREPEVRAYLENALSQWAQSLPSTIERTYDPELEESLRALGYLD